MDQNLVKKLVNEAISDNESLFLIELSFLVGNRIKVVVDGDQGISIKECMRISRHVEHSFDREEEDFGLEVTSPDISHPLTVRRQYLKNIDRVLKVKTEEEELEEENRAFVGAGGDPDERLRVKKSLLESSSFLLCV